MDSLRKPSIPSIQLTKFNSVPLNKPIIPNIGSAVSKSIVNKSTMNNRFTNIKPIITNVEPNIIKPVLNKPVISSIKSGKQSYYLPRIANSKINLYCTPKLVCKQGQNNYSNNPWLHVEGSNPFAKVIGKTYIGTVVSVPTSSKPCVELNIVDETDSKLMHLNRISTIQKQIQSTFIWINPINVTGIVPQNIFDEALSIYENNQVYYQECSDRNLIDDNSLRDGLTKLEHWFCCIIEPNPINSNEVDEWKDRELYKLRYGLSVHCDPTLYHNINKITENIKFFLTETYKIYYPKLLY